MRKVRTTHMQDGEHCRQVAELTYLLKCSIRTVRTAQRQDREHCRQVAELTYLLKCRIRTVVDVVAHW